MPNISWWEILLLAVVILLLFGPKRLPGIGRSAGRGLREFKETVTDQSKEFKEAVGTTPKEFKEGLNPFADDEKVEDAEVVETPAAPDPAVPAPAAPDPAVPAPAAQPEPEPVAAVPQTPAEPPKSS
jgi:sec-independent protein translocase protein TatA